MKKVHFFVYNSKFTWISLDELLNNDGLTFTFGPFDYSCSFQTFNYPFKHSRDSLANANLSR